MSEAVKKDLDFVRRAEPAEDPSPEILRFLIARAGRYVLDLGGGRGAYSEGLKKKGITCVCADIDPGALAEAKLRGLHAIRMDAQKTAFRDKSFDTVILVEVLEHVTESRSVLAECARIARSNVLITTPNHESYFWLKSRGLYLEASLPSDHLHFFTKDTLENLLGRTFSAYSVFYAEPITLFEGTKPICYRRLYAEAGPDRGVVGARSAGLVQIYHEPLSVEDFLRLPSSTELSDQAAVVALRKLLDVYESRSDLQTSFPEVRKGNYSRLLRWASDVVTQGTHDSAVGILSSFDLYFLPKKLEEFSKQIHAREQVTSNLEHELSQLREELGQTKAQLSELESRLQALNSEKIAVIEDLNHVREELHQSRAELFRTTRELEIIRESFGFNLMKFFTRRIDRIFPDGSKRGEFWKIVVASLKVARTQGIRSLLRQISEKLARREFRLITPEIRIPQVMTRDTFRASPLNEQYRYLLLTNQLDQNSIKAMITDISKFSVKPLISVVMPTFNTEDRWLRSAIESVLNQVYDRWELCIADDGSTRGTVSTTIREYCGTDARIKVTFLPKRSGIAAASNAALRLASGEFVAFLDHDDELTRDALFEVVKCINQHPDAELIFTDEDRIDFEGKRTGPFFKPDWSPDLLLSMNYFAHLLVLRRSVLQEIGGFRSGFEGSQDYDLALRATEKTNCIYHVPKVVYSWRMSSTSTAASLAAKPYARAAAKRALAEALERRHIRGEVLDGYNYWYRVMYTPIGDSLVSVIVITHDNPDLLSKCLTNIKRLTAYRNFEVIVVDHESRKPETLSYLRSLDYPIIKYEGEFNFSKINNLATKAAKGRYLLFLNDDVEALESNWLSKMVGILDNRDDVGAVGAKLLYPDGRIQHAGVILGLGGTAGHPFRGNENSDSCYFGFPHVIRNWTAVTAACMLVRRKVFEALGGFDEKLAVGGNDVDLCVRMQKAGYRVVYTPYAVLRHCEGATRKGPFPLSDYNYFVSKLRDDIRAGDPYYHPSLSVESEEQSYCIDPRLVGL